MALMRYQFLPERTLPEHVDRQYPPTTLATTDTVVPLGMVFRIRELEDALVRRFAVHIDTFDTVAPRASPGDETDTTANTSIADKADVRNTFARDGRLGPRGRDRAGTSVRGEASIIGRKGSALWPNRPTATVSVGPQGLGPARSSPR
jgi:hypothetical protein